MPRPYLSDDELQELTPEERNHLESEIRQEMEASGGDAERIRESPPNLGRTERATGQINLEIDS